MAARSDAAAALGPKDGAFMSFNVVCSSPNSVNLPLTQKEITPKHIQYVYLNCIRICLLTYYIQVHLNKLECSEKVNFFL